MDSVVMKWLLTVMVLLVGWVLSIALRGATKRLGRRRGYSRARIFQTAVVINSSSLLLCLLAQIGRASCRERV